MGNSLNERAGKPIHAHCEKELPDLKEKKEIIPNWIKEASIMLVKANQTATKEEIASMAFQHGLNFKKDTKETMAKIDEFVEKFKENGVNNG